MVLLLGNTLAIHQKEAIVAENRALSQGGWNRRVGTEADIIQETDGFWFLLGRFGTL